ncbi:hypothetical protein GCM10009836_11050 [Pseudonocardia ailaonensis]|uniref:Uncharacterized protein n=1 Tax=Pseudonocardia ailaonensis TaxID=367279 RepID=A0ABN2MQ95_9PSEU
MGAATAAVVLVLGATGASAEQGPAPVQSQARAFSVGGMLVSYDSDAVSSRGDDDPQRSFVASADLSKLGVGLSTGALTAEARGHQAQTTVADLKLLTVLQMQNVRTWCNGADGGSAGLDFTRGSLLGKTFAVPASHQELGNSTLIKVELDTVTRDKGSISAKGVVITLLGGNDPARTLTPTEKELGKGLAGLLGAPAKAQNATTVGSLLGALGVSAGAPGDPVLQVTVGAVSCALEDAPAKDEPTTTAVPTTDEDEPVAPATPVTLQTAPTPEVVPYRLGVTG